MKIPKEIQVEYIVLLVSLLLFILIFPFIAKGSTVYQQLTDSSGDIFYNQATQGCGLIGSFTVNASSSILGTNASAQIAMNIKTGSTNHVRLWIATSSPDEIGIASGNCNGTIFTNYNVAEYNLTQIGGGSVSLGEGQILVATSTQVFLNQGASYVPGFTYYVGMRGGQSGAITGSVVSNLSKQFFWGYITSGEGAQLPIVAGIPGFTDVGISTTSQQQYCYGNFGTSTGLLDSVGQSISLGLCNAAVFLFIPSSNAIGQFYNLASTTTGKIPFSYVFDIRNVFAAMSASSTSNFFSVALAFPDITSSTPIGTIIPTTITFLSTSTISTYIPDSVRLTFLNFQRMFLWLAFGFMIYRRVVPPRATI